MTTTAEPSTSKQASHHASSATDRQRAQLEKLFKDPAKPAYIPPPPKEKTVRPAREMMKNVQGSSAGAGSGEFHVYKASRRREYERIKLMEDAVQKETVTADFERRRKEAEEVAEAKTAKNRAKRQKKKERAKGKGAGSEAAASTNEDRPEAPIKKRRLISGKEIVFRKPGQDSEEEDIGPELPPEEREDGSQEEDVTALASLPVAETPRIVIHEDE